MHVTRSFFLIALLSVLLPSGVIPAERMAMAASRPFVSNLRAMSHAARSVARDTRRQVAVRPVRGVYLIPARRPKALSVIHQDTLLPDRPLWRPSNFRGPPRLA